MGWSRKKAEKAQQEQMVLDEAIDAAVCRPLGRIVARGCVEVGLSANQVTLVAGTVGVLAGAGFAAMGHWPIFGAAMLFVFMVLDCADGDVARIRGETGWRGRMIDGVSDLATCFSVHLGLLIHLSRAGVSAYGYEFTTLGLFLLALGAGVSLAWNAAVVDDVKQRLKGDSIDPYLEHFKKERRTVWDRFLYAFLVGYVRRSAQATGPGRPGGYDCYRRSQWAGPSHHLFAIVVCGVFMPVWPGIALVYFVAAIVIGNLWMLGVLRNARDSERLST